MEKVNVDVIKPWVTKRITEMLGFDDDVILEFVVNMLETDKVYYKSNRNYPESRSCD